MQIFCFDVIMLTAKCPIRYKVYYFQKIQQITKITCYIIINDYEIPYGKDKIKKITEAAI